MRFKINDYVYTINYSKGAIDIEQKRVQAITATCLGSAYELLGTDNSIEVCFERNVYTLDEIVKMDHSNA